MLSVRVDRLFDCAHDAYRFTVLGGQKVGFAAADAVFACARPGLTLPFD
jgi:hypothetical protein